MLNREEILSRLPLKEFGLLSIGAGCDFKEARELAFSMKEELGEGVLFADGVNRRVTFISVRKEEHFLKLLVDILDTVDGDISSSRAYTSFKDVDRLLEDGFDSELVSRAYNISKIKEVLD